MENNLNKQESCTTTEPDFVKRFIGIIISPYRIMPFIVNKPKIIFGLFSAFFSSLLYDLIRYPLFVEFVRHNSEKKLNVTLTDAQLHKAVLTKLISTPIVTVVYWLMLTSIVFGIAKLLKAKGGFKQYLSVTSYMYVIIWLIYLVYFISSFFSGKLITDYSAAALTDAFSVNISNITHGILRNFELLTLWYFFILYVGIREISKLSKAKTAGIVSCVFIIIVLISAFSS